MKNKKIRYFKSYDQDFYQTDKRYTLKKDYKYIPNKMGEKAVSCVVYILAFLFSSIYCRLFLHVRFVGRKKLKSQKDGFFVYANHTQPIGDVFNPALACFPKRIYTVVSPANLHLPVIGKLIRPLGALPLPDTLSGMIKFSDAVKKRINDGHPVIIYPEAHLWDYYTGIRPFDETSFGYPAKLDVPVYCFTTTYQKRRWGKKPRITIYIDGPFLVKSENKREKAKELRNLVFDMMKERSKMSDYEYIKYVQK